MEKNISDNEYYVRKSMQVFAGKWTLPIDLRINRRIKKQYREVPPRVEYSLTSLGEKELLIIDKITKFKMENL